MTIAFLSASVAFYAIGVARLWWVSGIGRGVRVREVAAFAAGWFFLAIALESPLHEWSEELFAAHMVQHELIMVIAAPLMALSGGLVATLWALPRRLRRGLPSMVMRVPGVAWLQAPGVAFCLHAVALWAWHIPSLFGAAVDHPAIHGLQHFSFFATAVLFWWTVAQGRYGGGTYGASVLYVFGTATQSGVLGALLAFSQRLWYVAYSSADQAALWHLTPAEDQQLAGLVMWVPAGVIFTATGLTFLAFWLRQSERRVGPAFAAFASRQGGRHGSTHTQPGTFAQESR